MRFRELDYGSACYDNIGQRESCPNFKNVLKIDFVWVQAWVKIVERITWQIIRK